MTGIIVLCRFSSSRLPGKILMAIEGKTILEYIVERLGIIKGDIPIVICTSDHRTDDKLAEFCQQKGWKVFRGSLENVAKRFKECALSFGFENAVRINGDNLFLDPQLIQTIIEKHLLGNYNFSSNVRGRTFPKGMSVEVVNVDYYLEKFPHFNMEDFEHVMTYFYRADNRSHKHHYSNFDFGETLNFAIDTREDFEKATMIIGRMHGNHLLSDMKRIIELYKNIDEEK